MPNGFCQPICRLILPVDPIPTRRRGKARRRARQADAKQAVGTNAAEQTRLRAPPGQTRLRSARKESSSFGLGRGFSRPPPGRRVGSTPWRIRLARPDPRLASSGEKEERNGAETWERRLSAFVDSVAGRSERRGEGGGGRGESRKKGEKKNGKGGKNTKGRMGQREKKRRTKAGVRRFAAPGAKKKRSHAASSFQLFSPAPRAA